MKGVLLRIEQAATFAVLVPPAVAFGLGVIAWGVARDLQRTKVARVDTVRRLLVWIGGDARNEGEPS